ncbi:copper resistance protein B [Parasphingopyxis lamellibrachiae]|uniref:Copper resistance protein B n=1 Tax=Parasphingopyxis lamellibrachiae TaxID=680125 RepID=A0A3D9FFR2_9SPHN|nr:copper resistance protein B [Parasphingopyxis lamellibrachiae]RED16665.1 copper resistance protein B [Parasphingopyxis lamellibrachiae]
MKRLITLTALLAAAPAPAAAQHQGHNQPVTEEQGEHDPSTTGGHAGQGTTAGQHEIHGEEEGDDPHAGHHMTNDDAPDHDHGMGQASPDDPPMDHTGHASHRTGSEGSIDDGQSGHAMHQSGSLSSGETDPHAGHQMDEASAADAHQGHDMGAMDQDSAIPQSGPPPEAFSGPAHAADTVFPPEVMAEARSSLPPELGGAMHSLISIDRLEAQIADGEDGYVWELNAWYGGDIDKLWVKSEGEGEFGGALEEAEIQALWSHAIGPYFDVQAGIRYDIRPEPDRAHAVFGIQGLAPYFFEIDVAGFLSDEGDLTGRIEAEYDQRITQRLILQPRVELNLAAQDIPEIGIGAGLSAFEAGLRLRYEFVPEFAPYIGVEWQQQMGDTADFARAAGEDPSRVVFLTGVRIWF